MIVITAATGHLGTRVVHELLKRGIPSGEVVALARNPEKAGPLRELGVTIREADYSRPETFRTALDGVDKLLLISGTDFGSRFLQHRAVIDAAKQAGARLLAYTSILHANDSPIQLATDHVLTEIYLRRSGLPYTLLRNGWYHENLTAAIPASLERGSMIGCSGNGRFAAASRADYAAAAAAVLASAGHENQTYELAGDSSYTRAELAAEVSRQSGKSVGYNDLTNTAYAGILGGFLPPDLAHLVADADAKAKYGALEDALEDTSLTLQQLIGHPTQSLEQAVAAALAG